MPSIQAAPAQTYPAGETVGATGAFKARTINQGACSIPAAGHTDPATVLAVVIDFLREDDTWWENAVGISINGSPDGWQTRQGRTTTITFTGEWSGGIVVKGGRIRVIVTGQPVPLGPITLTWN
jgi:hypothetical protein